jgi:hypothetical protein
VEIGFSYATARTAASRLWFNCNTDSCLTRTQDLPIYCLEQ